MSLTTGPCAVSRGLIGLNFVVPSPHFPAIKLKIQGNLSLLLFPVYQNYKMLLSYAYNHEAFPKASNILYMD